MLVIRPFEPLLDLIFKKGPNDLDPFKYWNIFSSCNNAYSMPFVHSNPQYIQPSVSFSHLMIITVRIIT